MPVADASWIATRYDEQCRSAIDHKSSDVRNGSDAKLLVEREPKAHKRRHLTAKPRRIDLSLTSLRKSGCRGAVPSTHHDNTA
jgi:hypothetical protein